MYEISSSELKCDSNLDEQKFSKIDVTASYENFFHNFMIKNKPCIITNVAKNWPAYNNWQNKNYPNIHYLIEKYRDLEVCVSDCNKRYFNAQETKTLTFGEYGKYWKEFIDNNYSNKYPKLYLKDWHLRKNTGEHFYDIPLFFASDWLNEYLSDKLEDDYMFVYMGPKGSW